MFKSHVKVLSNFTYKDINGPTCAWIGVRASSDRYYLSSFVFFLSCTAQWQSRRTGVSAGAVCGNHLVWQRVFVFYYFSEFYCWCELMQEATLPHFLSHFYVPFLGRKKEKNGFPSSPSSTIKWPHFASSLIFFFESERRNFFSLFGGRK